MNKVILMGRLTREPELRYTSGENSMAIARYSLAVDRRGRKDSNQTADFLNCVAFGKNAEFTEKYLHKGIKILLSGRLQTGSYTNREGQKVYTVEVVVEEQEFAESKNANTANGTFEERRREDAMQGRHDGFMEIPDDFNMDDLPFN